MGSDDDLLAYTSILARATTDKVLAEAPIPGWLPATVIGPPPGSTTGTMHGVVMVHLDQDAPDVIVPADVLMAPPAPGDRVMVVREPPWGLYVLFPIGQPVADVPMVGRVGACHHGGGG